MSAGVGIFLLVAGAILYWGIEADVSGLDIGLIGVILMVGGAATLLISLVLMGRRRRSTVTTHVDPNTGTRQRDIESNI
jgi:membrane-bound ClpP family serine protease